MNLLHRLLAHGAAPWLIRWFFSHEPKQIDFNVDGEWGRTTTGGVVGHSFKMSSRESARLLKAMGGE